MKHLYTLLFSATLLLAGTQAKAQCNPVFYDGFESGSYSPTWTVGTDMTATVTTNSPASGTYRLEGTGGNLTHLNGASTSFTAATPTQISWWIYPTANGSTNYFVAGNSSVSATSCIVFCYWAGASNAIRFVAASNIDVPEVAGFWYHIELRNINWSAHTFDIYINNSLQATAFPFRSNTQNNISRVHLYNYNSGAAAWDDITIGTGASPVLSNVSTNATCFGSTNGAIDLSVSGGATPYTYAWSNSANTQDISGLAAGTYSVSVTDNNGCVTTATNINITQPTALSFSSSNTMVSCFNGSNGAADVTVSGGTPGYTFAWSNSAMTEDLTSLTAGTYSVTITDNNGCTQVDSVSITEPTAVSATASSTPLSCSGFADGSLSVSASGGTPGYTYMWNNGGFTPTMSNITFGNYTCTVTDVNGCTTTANTTITQPSPITTSFSSTTIACNGGTGSLTASATGGTPGYTYVWSNGPATDINSGIAAGTYTVTVTDNNGCTQVDSIALTQPAALTISSSFTDVLCNGGTTGDAMVTVGGGTPSYTYAWSNGATSADNNGIGAGMYIATATDSNGCTITTTVTITEPTAISVSTTPSNPTSCANPDGMIDASVSGGTPGYTYSWSNSDTTQDISNLGGGAYQLTVTDANGCTSMTSVTLNGPALPNVTLNIVFPGVGDSLCITDGARPLNGESPAGGTWSGTGVSGSNFTASTAGLGVHPVTYTYTDQNGCTNTAIDNITVITCVGFEEQAIDQRIQLFPNPAHDAATLEINGLNEPVRVELFNAIGERVDSWMMNQSIMTVNLNDKANGVYLLNVYTPQGIVTKKLIKE